MARSDNQLSLITKALTGSLYHIYIQMVVHTKSNSKLSMTGFFLLSAFFCFPIVHTVNKDTHSSCHTSNKRHQSWELYKNALRNSSCIHLSDRHIVLQTCSVMIQYMCDCNYSIFFLLKRIIPVIICFFY